MSLYIDGRFAVSGNDSHLNLQNPINITKEIRKEISNNSVGGNNKVVLSYRFDFLTDNKIALFTVPEMFYGYTITNIEMTAGSAFGTEGNELYEVGFINPVLEDDDVLAEFSFDGALMNIVGIRTTFTPRLLVENDIITVLGDGADPEFRVQRIVIFLTLELL